MSLQNPYSLDPYLACYTAATERDRLHHVLFRVYLGLSILKKIQAEENYINYERI